MKMNKWKFLTAAAALTLVLTACGDDKGTSKDDKPEASEKADQTASETETRRY